MYKLEENRGVGFKAKARVKALTYPHNWWGGEGKKENKEGWFMDDMTMLGCVRQSMSTPSRRATTPRIGAGRG